MARRQGAERLPRRGAALPGDRAAIPGLGCAPHRALGRRAREPAVVDRRAWRSRSRSTARCGGSASIRSSRCIGTAIVMSLPILNVHIALAGYADLPMAAYLTLGTLAALHAVRARSVTDAALALRAARRLRPREEPGQGMADRARPRLPRRGHAAAGPAACRRRIRSWRRWRSWSLARSGINILGYQLSPQFGMPWNALFDAYFSFGNWNLLWYCAIATAVLGWRQLAVARRRAVRPVSSPQGSCSCSSASRFTNAGAWVEDQSTVNRATLHLAPLIVVWMLVDAARVARSRGASANLHSKPVAG